MAQITKKRYRGIIDKLEPTGRGSYTDRAGYISADGEMDINILIRNVQRIDSHLSYQDGAGRVADSAPRTCVVQMSGQGRGVTEGA